ncbi:MoaD/ThiS family protein [Sulfurospirillum sp. 1612]|uniref:MoaD/ThiS family protein n=1 Tax=Sulfurospirillum sp. 1612 TaxID=3094835 RepID=UPI002F948129
MAELMEITVKLFAQYREGRFKSQQRQYPKGSTAQHILEDVGIDKEKLPVGVLMVNGRHVEEDFVLEDGQIFTIFPKVGGG